jgi:hypothetical protein
MSASASPSAAISPDSIWRERASPSGAAVMKSEFSLFSLTARHLSACDTRLFFERMTTDHIRQALHTKVVGAIQLQGHWSQSVPGPLEPFTFTARALTTR